MKCKDCTIDCPCRTSDGEKECELQDRIIQVPNEWHGVRIQAAIAAMQGLLSNLSNLGSSKEYAEAAINYADALIEELRRN